MSAPTRFKASCPDCRRNSELDAEAFRLTVGRTVERTFYSFSCPACGGAVRKRAGERIVQALIAAGVPTMRLHLGLQGHPGRLDHQGRLDQRPSTVP